MSDHFNPAKDLPVQRRAIGAYITQLLEDVLPPLRAAARGCGYAIAVHGSLQRDIDLVAVPWTVGAYDPEELVERLLGVLAGALGRAIVIGEWKDKPHGRRALTISTCGDAEFDISIMPRVVDEKDEGA